MIRKAEKVNKYSVRERRDELRKICNCQEFIGVATFSPLGVIREVSKGMTRTSSFGFKFVIKLARLTSHACQLTNKLGLLLGTREGKVGLSCSLRRKRMFKKLPISPYNLFS